MSSVAESRSDVIGALPSSWTASTIGALFEVQQGKALSPAARRGLAPRPFLRTANVLWGRLNLSVLDEMDFDETEVGRLELEHGDLLVCEGGDIGRTALWRDEISGCLYQNHLHRLRRRAEDVEPEFVQYWLQAAFRSFRLFAGVGNKTTIPNLSGSRLKSLFVPQPPLHEQRAIASVLSRVQGAIALEDRRIALLKELKAATMAKVFREGLRGEPPARTPIGACPASWAIVPLSEAVTIASGQVDPRTEPYRSMIHIGPEDVEEATGRLLTPRSAAELNLISGKYLFQAGDIVYSKIRPYLRKAALAETGGICSADMYPLRSRAGFDSSFVHTFLLSGVFTCQATAEQARTGIPKVNREQLLGCLIPKPDINEQREIARLARLLDSRIAASITRHERLAESFVGTLHRLMTGQLRVTPLLDQEDADAG